MAARQKNKPKGTKTTKIPANQSPITLNHRNKHKNHTADLNHPQKGTCRTKQPRNGKRINNTNDPQHQTNKISKMIANKNQIKKNKQINQTKSPSQQIYQNQKTPKKQIITKIKSEPTRKKKSRTKKKKPGCAGTFGPPSSPPKALRSGASQREDVEAAVGLVPTSVSNWLWIKPA